jgi:hypothetical protein
LKAIYRHHCFVNRINHVTKPTKWVCNSDAYCLEGCGAGASSTNIYPTFLDEGGSVLTAEMQAEQVEAYGKAGSHKFEKVSVKETYTVPAECVAVVETRTTNNPTRGGKSETISAYIWQGEISERAIEKWLAKGEEAQ